MLEIQTFIIKSESFWLRILFFKVMFVICHYNGLLIPKQGQLLLHHIYRILFGHDQTNDVNMSHHCLL